MQNLAKLRPFWVESNKETTVHASQQKIYDPHPAKSKLALQALEFVFPADFAVVDPCSWPCFCGEVGIPSKKNEEIGIESVRQTFANFCIRRNMQVPGT